jgi:carbamoyl-phosphate synthase large subunit
MQVDLNMPYIPFVDAKVAKTSKDVVNTCGLPCIYKPYSSYAGKGLSILYQQSEVDSKLLLGEGIFQEYINSNKEYTVSVFGLSNGDFINPIAFERQLGPDGATHKALVVDFSLFEASVRLLCEQTRPEGPTNFQFIASNDDFLLLEVNPRISSSTSMRLKFGINEAQMCIQYYLNKQKPNYQEVKYGRAERFLDEVVTYDSDNI